MAQLNGHDNKTWESHNKMMLEPLSTNDPEVSVWLYKQTALKLYYFESMQCTMSDIVKWVS